MDLKGLLGSNTRENTYNGVVKDLRQVTNNDNIFKRWINSLFKGVPFTLGKDRYVFIIKDNTAGKGHRAIAYGKQVGDKLSDGSVCYLTGDTDKNGVIIVKRLYDPQTNIHVEADRVYPCVVARIASALCVLLLVYLVYSLSHIEYTTFSIIGSQTTGMLSIVVLFALAIICLRNRKPIVKKIGWVVLALAVFTLYPPIVVIVVVFFLVKKFLFR
ncbi:MAG: hypothetical protein K6E47_03820 [Lachnospiraceae bacterium]|nr:hypothetical protein [Lachnospiraceae bacterium]